jgi:hypothetical protein
MATIGRPKGSKNATPQQLLERAKAIQKEAALKKKIIALRKKVKES